MENLTGFILWIIFVICAPLIVYLIQFLWIKFFDYITDKLYDD